MSKCHSFKICQYPSYICRQENVDPNGVAKFELCLYGMVYFMALHCFNDIENIFKFRYMLKTYAKNMELQALEDGNNFVYTV
uniref:Uncharacterized protein n=1 Tax=Acrobeloides nanus TaxID=290746 RepID=A0A914CET0_9BILA